MKFDVLEFKWKKVGLHLTFKNVHFYWKRWSKEFNPKKNKKVKQIIENSYPIFL